MSFLPGMLKFTGAKSFQLDNKAWRYTTSAGIASALLTRRWSREGRGCGRSSAKAAVGHNQAFQQLLSPSNCVGGTVGTCWQEGILTAQILVNWLTKLHLYTVNVSVLLDLSSALAELGGPAVRGLKDFCPAQLFSPRPCCAAWSEDWLLPHALHFCSPGE